MTSKQKIDFLEAAKERRLQQLKAHPYAPDLGFDYTGIGPVLVDQSRVEPDTLFFEDKKLFDPQVEQLSRIPIAKFMGRGMVDVSIEAYKHGYDRALADIRRALGFDRVLERIENKML